MLPLLAGVLAWLIPGAGHVYLGRAVRGVILCLCINALFWTGVAVGGVFTVEPVTQRWWFAAQMCTGASGLAAWYRQDRVRDRISASIDAPAPRRGRAGGAAWQREFTEAVIQDNLDLNYPSDTVARAYSGVAGMLNLMAIFDAVMLAGLGRVGEPPPQGKQPPPEEREK